MPRLKADVSGSTPVEAASKENALAFLAVGLLVSGGGFWPCKLKVILMGYHQRHAQAGADRSLVQGKGGDCLRITRQSRSNAKRGLAYAE